MVQMKPQEEGLDELCKGEVDIDPKFGGIGTNS